MNGKNRTSVPGRQTHTRFKATLIGLLILAMTTANPLCELACAFEPLEADDSRTVKPTGLIGNIAGGLAANLLWDMLKNSIKNPLPPNTIAPGTRNWLPPLVPPNVPPPFVAPPVMPPVTVTKWKSPLTGQLFEIREASPYFVIESLDPTRGPKLVGTGIRQGNTFHIHGFGTPNGPFSIGRSDIVLDGHGREWFQGLTVYQNPGGALGAGGLSMQWYRVQ